MSDKRTHPSYDQREENVRLRTNYAMHSGHKRRACAWNGCNAIGEFRAPADREHLREYLWFCLDHVREYNRQWDYFAGMTAGDIENHRRADTTWHRPSWQFGSSATGPQRQWHDPFDFFEEDGPENRPQASTADTKSRQMMQILELSDGYSETQLKDRYKLMAKRHHPDLHNGDKGAEERLKRINEAYAHLKLQFT